MNLHHPPTSPLRPPAAPGVHSDLETSPRLQAQLSGLQQRLKHWAATSPATLYEQKLPLSLDRESPKGFERLLGMLSPVPWSDLLHDEDRQDTLAAWEQALVPGRPGEPRPLSTQYRLRHHGGRYVDIQDQAIVLFDAQGAPERVYGTMLDVTAQLEAEIALQSRDIALAAIQRQRTEQQAMIRAVTQGFAGPLEAMREQLGQADPALTPALRAGLAEALERLAEFAEELTDFAAIAGEGLKLERRVIELDPWLDQTLAPWLARAEAKGLRLELRRLAQPLRLAVDGPRLAIALGHLLSNALKFSPPGGCVELRAVLGDDGLALEVQDAGPGLGAEQLAELNAQERLPALVGRSQGGTGVGLWLCRAIATAHGGALHAESEPGGGTRVRLGLPFA